ncbi:MAG: hypothetical protein COB67_05150 [SAR324 cluster bacterium]|uniref:Uncharacterized protein n=1 Tax=SAR324 cluster bacterium TaxID=2024889 RepID=A0A2A4T641_9DELT|nr:MAG: hypothetical protein COB67_05150 [SAR324 cluster bacterium]
MEKKISEEMNERLSTAIQAVIKQQIAENDPPETVETLERLTDEGFTQKEAYLLIGKAISREVAEMLVVGQSLNLERFLAALEELPAPFVLPKKQDKEDET